MTTIAVSGGTGFIGSVLTTALKSEGHEVRILARNGAADAPGTTIRGDVRDRSAVEKVLEGAEAVIHLAPGVAPVNQREDSVVVGAQTLCEVAASTGVRRLVYLSCQGADAGARQSYLLDTWRAETIVRSCGVTSIVLRSSLVLGRGSVLLTALSTMLRVLPVLPVPGRGDVRFQPIDVQDVAQCLMLAATDPEEISESHTVSLGGPEFLTYRQLADLLGAALQVDRPKLLVPPAIALRILPGRMSAPFSEPWLSLLTSGVVASPGVVQRYFNFQPASVIPTIGAYVTA